MSWNPKDGDAWLNFPVAHVSLGEAAPLTLNERVEQLYRDHYGAVCRYLLATGSQPSDADEYAQEAFLQLQRSLQAQQAIENPAKWLIAVAQHLRIKAEQRERRTRLSQSELLVSRAGTTGAGPSPERDLIANERMARLQKAMDSLTPRQYEFLHLRAEGFTFAEIAQAHGISLQAVAETCARAIARLGKLTND